MLTPCRRAPEYFGLRVQQPVGPRPLRHVVDAGRDTLNEVVGLRRLTEPTYTVRNSVGLHYLQFLADTNTILTADNVVL